MKPLPNSPIAPFYLSDVDGTLLDRQGQLSTRSRELLLGAINQGVRFSIASARSYVSLRALFGDFPFRFPIIEFNGAFITDYHTGEHLEINSIEPDLCRQVFERVLGHGLLPFVMSFDGTGDRLHYSELINPAMQWYENRRRTALDPRLRHSPDLRKTLNEAVVSLTIMSPNRSAVEGLRDELRQAYATQLQLFCYENEYAKGNWWLTVHHARASKHLAMQTLLRDYVPGGGRVTAFGDNVNDLDMLQNAHRAVAVSNAHATVLAIADETIGHHGDDSVAHYVARQGCG